MFVSGSVLMTWTGADAVALPGSMATTSGTAKAATKRRWAARIGGRRYKRSSEIAAHLHEFSPVLPLPRRLVDPTTLFVEAIGAAIRERAHLQVRGVALGG